MDAEEIAGEITEEIVRRALTTAKCYCPTMVSQGILEEILGKVEHNLDLQDAYKERCKGHNQRKLMNLLQILDEFKIDESTYEDLSFRESLLISKLQKDSAGDWTSSPVGGICYDVQAVPGNLPASRKMEEYEGKLLRTLDVEGITDHIAGGSSVQIDEPAPSAGKFLVHVSSQFDFDGRNAGSNITSWVDKNLHTLEELRREFVNEVDFVNEKTLYVALKKKWYYVKHTSSVEGTDDRKLYSFDKARDYVSEGASIVLMRYLALTKYVGKFELATAYVNGDLCRNIYECFGPESEIINGVKVDICRIKRTIIEECGIESNCMTVLSLNGQLYKQEWEGCDYILQINPLAKIKNSKPTCAEDVKIDWSQDLQLMSKYLDQKNTMLLKNKSYLLDHPELKEIIADYVTEILQLRPPDILEYTLAYFGTYADTTLPRNDYFH